MKPRESVAPGGPSRLRALVEIVVFGVALVGLFLIDESDLVRAWFAMMPRGFAVPAQVFVNAQVLVVLAIAFVQKDPNPAATLGLVKKDGRRAVAYGVLLYAALMASAIAVAILVAGVDLLKDPTLELAAPKHFGLRGISDPRVLEELAAVPLAVGLPLMCFVGVYEEILFRGFLMSRMKTLFGGEGAGAAMLAVVGSSLAFAAVHTYKDALGIGVTFLLGVAFATVAMLRKQIYSGMIAHALLDLTVLGALHAVVATHALKLVP